MTFGEKLQALRTRAGLSQDALAEALDVSRQAVSKWERDEAMPEAEKLVRISDRFSVTIDSLLRPDRELAPQQAEAPAAGGLPAALGGWYTRRGWLLGVPAALWGLWRLLGLAGRWDSVSQLVLEGHLTGGQGFLWLLFTCRTQAGAAAGLLLAGILWILLGRRRNGGLRWYHAGWSLAAWGAADLLFQCTVTALTAAAAEAGLARDALAGQAALLWQGLGAQAVYAGGLALAGLAAALGGRRLERTPRRAS